MSKPGVVVAKRNAAYIQVPRATALAALEKTSPQHHPQAIVSKCVGYTPRTRQGKVTYQINPEIIPELELDAVVTAIQQEDHTEQPLERKHYTLRLWWWCEDVLLCRDGTVITYGPVYRCDHRREPLRKKLEQMGRIDLFEVPQIYNRHRLDNKVLNQRLVQDPAPNSHRRWWPFAVPMPSVVQQHSGDPAKTEATERALAAVPELNRAVAFLDYFVANRQISGAEYFQLLFALPPETPRQDIR